MKTTGDSFDDLTALLLERLPNYAHNIAHGTSDPLDAAGFLRMLGAQLAELRDKWRGQIHNMRVLAGPPLEPGDDAPPSPAAKPPRHKFNAEGVCTANHGPGICGAIKGRGGRPPKNVAPVATVDGVTKVDPPSQPLPLGDAAADKFAGGGLGSSGVRR